MGFRAWPILSEDNKPPAIYSWALTFNEGDDYTQDITTVPKTRAIIPINRYP